MSTSAVEIEIPFVENVTVSDDTLTVDLSDGRSISVPLAWYPRLSHASSAERKHWRRIGRGVGIHWEEIDEDISIEGLLAGRRRGKARRHSANGSRSVRRGQQHAQHGRAGKRRAPVSFPLRRCDDNDCRRMEF